LVVIDLSLSILYLLPISFVSWYGKRWFSLLLVLVSTVGWLIAESAAKTDLHPFLLLWNTTVRFIVFLTIAYLFSSLKQAYEKEKTLAQIDGLTGIANRSFFLELLKQESKRSHRYSRCLTLAYFDLDNFKQINDRLGHNAGDKLLKLVAQTIKKEIRATDTIARLGGDEFALLLIETSYEQGQIILPRLQQKLMTAIQNSPNVSLSIGAVTFLTIPDSVDEMLEKADILMYKVKKNGKNNIEYQLFN
jgi:diguanylate cyclase (GGDEF)-like protein